MIFTPHLVFCYGDFAAARHKPELSYSHHELSQAAVLALVSTHWSKRLRLGREGVVAVQVPPAGFYSGTVALEEGIPLFAVYARRKGGKLGEAPYLQTTARGPKLPALAVEVVLYRRDVLLENDGEASGPAAPRAGWPGEGPAEEWEVVSVNARPTLEPEPLHPVTMARNALKLPGGTPAVYTAEELLDSIVYWSHHANVAEGSP